MAKIHPRKKQRKKAKEERKRLAKKEGNWKPSKSGQSGTGTKSIIKTRSDRDRNRSKIAALQKERSRRKRV